MELFKLMTKTDIVHVPYRATTTAMADLMGGRIDLALIGLSSAKPQVEAGKLRAYAIASPQRSSLMPDVPTVEEAGLPGYEVRSWFGMLAPAKTPPSASSTACRARSRKLRPTRIHRSACSARHADHRLLPRGDGEGDARGFQEMGRGHPGDRHHDQSIEPRLRNHDGAAVHGDRLSRHVAGIVAEQERHRRGDILRLADAAERNARARGVKLVVAHLDARLRGVGQPRNDAIDADAVAGPVERQRFG